MPLKEDRHTNTAQWRYITDPERTSISLKIFAGLDIEILINHSDRFRILRSRKAIIEIFSNTIEEMGNEILESLDIEIEENDE